jgi:hypothetical protein
VVRVEDDEQVGVDGIDMLAHGAEELGQLAVGIGPHVERRAGHVGDAEGANKVSHQQLAISKATHVEGGV